jgi:hypothetical protein
MTYDDKILRSIALNHKAGEAQTEAITECEDRGVSLDKSDVSPDYSETDDHVLKNIAEMSHAAQPKREAAVSELGSRE